VPELLVEIPSKPRNSYGPFCPSVCHVVVYLNKRRSTIMQFTTNGSPVTAASFSIPKVSAYQRFFRNLAGDLCVVCETREEK